MTSPAVTTDTDAVCLEAGGYVARLGRQGAALHSLRYDGRELTLRAPGVETVPPFAGAVLAPWPNRVANGRYHFDGRPHQLPVNEVGRGNALHGLALWEDWTVESTSTSATFGYTIRPRPGYPFTVAVHALYAVSGDGLELTVVAFNAGGSPAPVGLSAHPYLAVGDGGVLDDWTMQLPCDDVIVTDDRLLPRATRPVAGQAFDFRRPARIGPRELDHAYTGIAFAAGVAEASLVGPDGTGVRIGWDERCRWLQVYTLHAPGEPLHRRAVAVEPMTCAPDAFNSGAGLTVLEPGETTSARMVIGAVTP